MSGDTGSPIVVDDRSGLVREATREEAAALDDEDGRLPEPTREDARLLWRWLIATLCIILLAMSGTFVYLAIRGAIDSAALVGIFMGLLAATMDLYRRRQS